jgi:hypothetical protein
MKKTQINIVKSLVEDEDTPYDGQRKQTWRSDTLPQIAKEA